MVRCHHTPPRGITPANPDLLSSLSGYIQVLGSGKGSSGPPSSGGLSVFRVPQLEYLEGQGGGAEEEEEFLLPFAVDDGDLMRRSR